MKQYWSGMHLETDWRAGSSWQLMFPDGRIADTSEIVEINPPKRLVFEMAQRIQAGTEIRGIRAMYDRAWANSLCCQADDHSFDRSPGVKIHRSRFRRLATYLSNLKSLLETEKIVLS
jgi:Activator of Hsp90 ATPase homolog 1-like protein